MLAITMVIIEYVRTHSAIFWISDIIWRCWWSTKKISRGSSRLTGSNFFWSHLSHSSNFFTPSVFVKQNSNWAVLYDEI